MLTEIEGHVFLEGATAADNGDGPLSLDYHYIKDVVRGLHNRAQQLREEHVRR